MEFYSVLNTKANRTQPVGISNKNESQNYAKSKKPAKIDHSV